MLSTLLSFGDKIVEKKKSQFLVIWIFQPNWESTSSGASELSFVNYQDDTESKGASGVK